MSDFDLWLREAYASTWVDWSPEALMLGRAAFDSQAAQLLDAKRNEERASAERLKDRERLTKTLRLDASHGPMPASMEFILASIDAVVRQAAGPVARLMSEPMVQCETTRLRAKLQRDGAKDAESKLYDELRHGKDHVYVTMRIAALIDAKVELALLERGGG